MANTSGRAMGRPNIEWDAPWVVLVVGRVEDAVSLFADLGEVGVLG